MQNATHPTQSVTADGPKASDSLTVATPSENASGTRTRRSVPAASSAPGAMTPSGAMSALRLPSTASEPIHFTR